MPRRGLGSNHLVVAPHSLPETTPTSSANHFSSGGTRFPDRYCRRILWFHKKRHRSPRSNQNLDSCPRERQSEPPRKGRHLSSLDTGSHHLLNHLLAPLWTSVRKTPHR